MSTEYLLLLLDKAELYVTTDLEIETSVKILILTGVFLRRIHWMYPRFFFPPYQGYAFAVKIVFICSLIEMYCTDWEWVLRFSLQLERV